MSAIAGVPERSRLWRLGSQFMRRWWWFAHVRRVQHEGLLRAWSRRRTWDAILHTPPVSSAAGSSRPDFELHLVCCLADYVSAIWALKTFLAQGRPNCHVCLHLQGHATGRMQRVLRTHLPDARIVTQEEADRRVVPILRQGGLVRLDAFRSALPVMLKLVDVALCATADRVLVLDSDVLFFQPPAHLIAAAGEPGTLVFQQDVESCYVITPEQARELGVDLLPRINTGIVGIDRAAIDLAACERMLAHPAFRAPSGWIEQTLYALIASRHGHVTLLPPTYAISMEAAPHPADLVARHYSGPSRPHLTAGGMRWLLQDRRFADVLARATAS